MPKSNSRKTQRWKKKLLSIQPQTLPEKNYSQPDSKRIRGSGQSEGKSGYPVQCWVLIFASTSANLALTLATCVRGKTRITHRLLQQLKSSESYSVVGGGRFFFLSLFLSIAFFLYIFFSSPLGDAVLKVTGTRALSAFSTSNNIPHKLCKRSFFFFNVTIISNSSLPDFFVVLHLEFSSFFFIFKVSLSVIFHKLLRYFSSAIFFFFLFAFINILVVIGSYTIISIGLFYPVPHFQFFLSVL